LTTVTCKSDRNICGATKKRENFLAKKIDQRQRDIGQNKTDK
jgi:hypothetical protein